MYTYTYIATYPHDETFLREENQSCLLAIWFGKKAGYG